MYKLIQSDFVCLDIGANIGSLTIPMAALCNKVFAFEAGFEIFGMLKTNVISNNIDNIEPLYLAISNKKDIVYFHHNRGNVGGSYVTSDSDSTQQAPFRLYVLIHGQRIILTP
jgi:FkbM family methyltransferase